MSKLRNINKVFKQCVLQEVDKMASIEEITLINENKSLEEIEVMVKYKDISGNVIGNDRYYIKEDNYTLIMSQSPNFAPNKPINEYREIDLWYIIDLIRNTE